MEGFPRENGAESIGTKIKLDEKKLMSSLWGMPIEITIPELIKISSIIRYIKKKGINTSEQFNEAAKDLFLEFGVALFDYDKVFTDEIVQQILLSKGIDEVTLEFNEKTIIIKTGSTPQSVLKDWEGKLQNETENTINEQEVKSKKKELIIQEQQLANEMLSHIGSLDFANMEKVINWLDEYNGYINNIGVNENKESLLKIFSMHGYSPKKNDKVDFMLGETLNDKERFGKAIIGYLLENLGLIRQEDIQRLTTKWKKEDQ